MNALDSTLIMAWLLASVRVVALVLVAPVFGNSVVPVRMRAAISILVAAAVAPTLKVAALPASSDPLVVAGAAIGELATGVALGFAARLVFDAVGLVGGLISAQGGLGAATLIDPGSGASTTSPSLLLESIAVLIYLAIDGHHALIRGLAVSFETLPAGGGGPPLNSLLSIAGLGADVFSIAVRLAAPVTAAMMLANIAMGILGRALPEMNLMMVQIPAHVLLMLSMVLVGVPAFGSTVGILLEGWTSRAVSAVLGGP